MDIVKTILTLTAIILVALAVLAGIGLIYSLLYYALLLGVICLGGYIAFRLLRKSDADQLPEAKANRQLKQAERLLDEYKRK